MVQVSISVMEGTIPDSTTMLLPDNTLTVDHIGTTSDSTTPCAGTIEHTMLLLDGPVWEELQCISTFLSMLTPIDSGEAIGFDVALRDRICPDTYYTACTLTESPKIFRSQLTTLLSSTVSASVEKDQTLLIPLNLLMFIMKGNEYAPQFIRMSSSLQAIATAVIRNIPDDLCITGRCDDVDNCSESSRGMVEDDSSDDPDYQSACSSDEENQSGQSDDEDSSPDDSEASDMEESDAEDALTPELVIE
jgi:hypothetical protein